MKREEVELAVEWAGSEGWNPGLGDARCFYEADPGGFFLAEAGGEPAGCVSAVRYGEHFGFIGFLIVRREFRGGRIGQLLARQALDRLAGRNIGIDGVDQKARLYGRCGFVRAHHTVRFAGEGGAAAAPVSGLCHLVDLPFDKLAAYDRKCFGAPRENFLKCWISQPRVLAVGHVSDGALRGYGVIRPCAVGWKIGPLYADAPEIAEALFGALRNHALDTAPIVLDVPVPNDAALALASKYGMRQIFRTARMYTQGDPGLPLASIYGITSFELG